MKKVFIAIMITVLSHLLHAQNTDTLRIKSAAFKSERTVYVRKPADYKYAGADVRFPVMYILDGQHDWFVKPMLQLVENLQQTKEVPQMLIVIIPLEDRINECNVDSLNMPDAPLHTLITKEIPNNLQAYRAGKFHALVGHSFSASFALYSAIKAPEFYDAVFAHSPMDALQLLVKELANQSKSNLSKIYYSVGSRDQSKDAYHYAAYQKALATNPTFFKNAHVYEANFSAHNAVPIVAMPSFLSECFTPFHNRFKDIAAVDMNYKMIDKPMKPEDEIKKLLGLAKLGNMNYPPEISDYNGIASRFLNSDYKEHALAVYLQAMQDYPNYYEFPAYAAELSKSLKPDSAKFFIEKAIELLNTFEKDLPEREEILAELNAILEN